ncbi:MAG: hypothetical protein AAFN92_03960, partial [Bacteroidota bacterium]
FALDYEQTNNVDLALTLLRDELRVIRPRYVAHHPADALYSFHNEWTQVVETTHDPMMCLLEWKEFAALVDRALNQWDRYVGNHPQHADYLFPGSGNNSLAVENQRVALQRALDDFYLQLRQADHTLLAEPSLRITKLYFDYLTVITNYPTGEVEPALK